MSLLLAQKESREERGSLDLNPYGKGCPHFRKGAHTLLNCMKRETIRLTKRLFFDMESKKNGSPNKAKPTVREGRKVAGVELVQAWPSCRRMNLRHLGFFLLTNSKEKGGRDENKSNKINSFCFWALPAVDDGWLCDNTKNRTS